MRRSSRLGRGDVKIPGLPAEPALKMSKNAANMKAPLSASKHVRPAARCVLSATAKVPLRASKRVPPAARCATPVMPVDAMSMSNATNVDMVPLSMGTTLPAARCKTRTVCTIGAVSMSSAESKTKVNSHSADSTRKVDALGDVMLKEQDADNEVVSGSVQTAHA